MQKLNKMQTCKEIKKCKKHKKYKKKLNIQFGRRYRSSSDTLRASFQYEWPFNGNEAGNWPMLNIIQYQGGFWIVFKK